MAPEPLRRSPRKRRRIGAASTPQIVDWPHGRIPVELFDLITAELTREDARNMRLVNREFELKTSGKYFKTVVVPFRPELYSTYREGSSLQDPSALLFSNGLRIFQSFGPHISRFALSLELKEDDLACPPLKPAQELKPTFWGIYRWPHAGYHRYSELEGLERTADETNGMKEALRCLTNLTDLGLCCDAGLGFLCGPDIHPDTIPEPHPVFFSTQRAPQYEPMPVPTRGRRKSDHKAAVSTGRLRTFDDSSAFKRHVLEQMALDAGYTQRQLNDVVMCVLETEGTTLGGIDFEEAMSVVQNSRERGANDARLAGEPEPDNHNQTRLLSRRDSSGSSASAEAPKPYHRLQPKNLTRAQTEMLLELEWAHRALVQSYVIAVIDNRSGFQNLANLTIAKIPSSHIPILHRGDFWDSLPSLTNFSLGVVADWRAITKPSPGCLEDTEVCPSASIPKVFKLLDTFVSRRESIKFLHFEWICGGEFAPGVVQRNMNVLPVPFATTAARMVEPDAALSGLLSLPHIEHLSLKNCWCVPHVFFEVIRRMALSSLERLELESVSLTGQPAAALQQPPAPPIPLQQFPPGNPNHHGTLPLPGFGGPQQLTLLAQQLGLATPTPLQPAAPALVAPPGHSLHTRGLERLVRPPLLTWAGIIENLTPGMTIRRLLHDQAHQDNGDSGDEGSSSDEDEPGDNFRPFIPEPDLLSVHERDYKLAHISFKSCGYIAIDAQFVDTHALFPGIAPWSEPTDVQARRRDLYEYMQHSLDKALGKVMHYIRATELHALTTAFGMDTGWQGVYDERVIKAAKHDGVDKPGAGRFSGVIDGRHP